MNVDGAEAPTTNLSFAAGQLTIRPITDLADYTRVEALQREVWHFASDTEIVPTHVLKAIAENGGLLLGAFGPQGVLVGFVFGFLARQEGQLKHHSHMLGVRPSHRNSGTGFRLKCAQREAVLEQGLHWATWTYDPLEGRNAYLNINKLGVVCNTYLRNMYGELRDSLNVGIPSDRFQVDWWLHSRRVEQRVSGEQTRRTLANAIAAGGEVVNETRLAGGVRMPEGSKLDSRSAAVLIEIPSDVQAVKRADMDGARRWRLHTRELFESYFGNGYTVTEFISEVAAGERRSFYLLESDNQIR